VRVVGCCPRPCRCHHLGKRQGQRRDECGAEVVASESEEDYNQPAYKKANNTKLIYLSFLAIIWGFFHRPALLLTRSVFLLSCLRSAPVLDAPANDCEQTSKARRRIRWIFAGATASERIRSRAEGDRRAVMQRSKL